MVIKGRKVGPNKYGIGSNPSILDVTLMDPKRNTRKERRMSFSYLWRGKSENRVLPWAHWERIEKPKAFDGWGLKTIFLFSKSLAAKSVW
jgi:hypothetical protein